MQITTWIVTIARPVHPIHTASGVIWGRSSGEVHFISREIEVEKCYGDLEKLPEKSIVVDGGLNLGIFSFCGTNGPGGLVYNHSTIVP